jgi:histidinol phosphatase-like enzyme
MILESGWIGYHPTEAKRLRPAVVLDRDGTLIEDRGHPANPADVEFLPGTIGALRQLQEEFVYPTNVGLQA